MRGIEAWWDAGRLVELDGRRLFVARLGAGPAATLLHGYPSSSHDWAKVAPALAERRTLLMPDLLGFGASDKPADHDYSIFEQADLVEALWRAEGVDATDVVAHDYSVTVTQELLARRAEGRLDVDLLSVTLLNGGLYPALHRPEPVQLALLDPEQGPRLVAAMTEEAFAAAVARTWGPGHDATQDVADIWASIRRGADVPTMHRLIAYIPERHANAERWTAALERTDVPLAFVWGMRDPISGAHMAQRIRERLPGAPLLALDDGGHWPPLEAPERVAGAVLAQLR